MTRVALFFDGKNHMRDFRRTAPERLLDHVALCDWTVAQVGGTDLVAAHYYTGVPDDDDDSGRRALEDLLGALERLPGFFVHRYKRVHGSSVCEACEHATAFTREKCVDTGLIADLVLMAALDQFDIAVVFSGDLDMLPGLEAVHRLGRKAWVAAFAGGRLTRSLVRGAWGVLDLGAHLDAFSDGALAPSQEEAGPSLVDAEVLRELRRAEQHFHDAGGFVGAHYFLQRWRGVGIPDTPARRRVSVERLMRAGLVETYDADGRAALRTRGGEE